MDSKTAHNVVKTVAVLYWVGAAFGLLMGLSVLLGGSFLGLGTGGILGGLFAGLAVLVSVVTIIFAALGAFVGYGLWQFKNWAKITAIVLAVISLLNFPFWTIFGIAVIYLFGFNDDVKRQFS